MLEAYKTNDFSIDGSTGEAVKACCFTGYRPCKFPFSVEKGTNSLAKLENAVIETVFSLSGVGTTFYTGMAMGFDIIAAEAVLLLKSRCVGTRLVCVLPYSMQGNGFPEPWRSRYNEIMRRADEVIVMSEDYYKGCYAKRNEFLVDNSDCVVTWFDGRVGGTSATIKYAKKLSRRIINLNADCSDEYYTLEMEL